MDLLSDNFKYDPEYHRFADYMGVDRNDRNDFRVAKKLALLYDWSAKRSKTPGAHNAVKQLDGLRKHLGVNFVGPTLVNFLYDRVRVNMDRDQAEEAKSPEFWGMKAEGRKWRKEQQEIKEDIKDRQEKTEKEAKEVVKEHRKEVRRPKPEPVEDRRAKRLTALEI